MATFGLEEVAGAVAIKASEWKRQEPAQEPRREVVRARVPDKPELPEKTAKVCYTHNLEGDPLELVPLVYPNRLGNEQEWELERWQANMALAAHHLMVSAPAVTCVDSTGLPRWHGMAQSAFLMAVYHGPGLSFRPEIMVWVWGGKKGHRGANMWPLGLILFEIEEAPK